jgi:hypothetical protein
VKQIFFSMEKQLMEIPILQKSKAAKPQSVKNQSSCCSGKDSEVSCCTPAKTKEEFNGACCEQPSDGSACCE